MRLERPVDDCASGHPREVIWAKTDHGESGDDLVQLGLEPEEILRRRKVWRVPADDADEPHEGESAGAQCVERRDDILELPVHVRVRRAENDSTCPVLGREVPPHARFEVSQETFAHARLPKAEQRLARSVETQLQESQHRVAELRFPVVEERDMTRYGKGRRARGRHHYGGTQPFRYARATA